MSQPVFKRGTADRPRGHAILYIRDTDSDRVAASYLIVLPIAIDMAKYIPPMLAAQMGVPQAGPPTATPIPPVPEVVPDGLPWLLALADARDDDVLDGGQAQIDRIEALVHQAAFAAQGYTELYTAYIAEATSQLAPENEPVSEIDAEDLTYALMGDAERLAELVRLTGRIRDGVGVGDSSQVNEMLAEARHVTRHLAEKYRADDLLRAAQTPGEAGRLLTELLIQRCYALLNEDYRRVQDLEQQIKAAG